MSADRRSDCPACLAAERGVPIDELTVRDIYQTENGFTAYQETFIDQGFLVVRYGAECEACGYHVSYNHKEPIPQPGGE